MESRERTETNREDREQGTPQGRLLNEERESEDSQEEDAAKEGGADSVSDASGKGG